MELRTQDIIFVVFPFLIFLFMGVGLLKKSRHRKPRPNLPPGPWKLPLIGNLHQLVGSLPHHRLRDLSQKFGPIMHLQLGQLDAIVISSPEAAKEVLKANDINFAQRPYFLATDVVFYKSTNIAAAPYGDYWRQLRKICVLELLSAKRVQSFRAIREEEVWDLVRHISNMAGSSSDPVNFSRMAFSLTYRIVSRVAFGKVGKHEDEFIEFLEELVKVLSGFSIAEVFPSVKFLHKITGMTSRLKKLHKQADTILDSIINQHTDSKQKPKSTSVEQGEVDHDLVDVLLSVRNRMDLELPLTLDNIKAVLLDIFSGGSDTSTAIVVWAFSEMLKHPRVLHRAQEEVRQAFGEKGRVEESGIGELHYLKLVVKETVRLHPPLPLLGPRENSEECEVGGYLIPRKTKAIVNAWAIGRDPKYWTEPEKFLPERFVDSAIDYKGSDFELIPFGAGRRICPGILFGIANVELPLANLLYHFDWKLPEGMEAESLDMQEEFGIIAGRKNALHLIPVVRHPLV